MQSPAPHCAPCFVSARGHFVLRFQETSTSEVMVLHAWVCVGDSGDPPQGGGHRAGDVLPQTYTFAVEFLTAWICFNNLGVPPKVAATAREKELSDNAANAALKLKEEMVVWQTLQPEP